ncbi:MAG: TolC family outer membrane protein [Pseudomonadota bacterium]
MNRRVHLLALLFALSAAPLQAQSLLETYELALDNDPVIREAYAKRNSALESRPLSVARLLPTLSVSGSSSRDRIHNKKGGFQGSGTQNFWTHRIALDFTQPVFHWDFWVQLSQADNRVAEAEADYQAAQQDLILRTSEAYFNILAADDNLLFAAAEKSAIARQLDQAQQRFEVGLIAITDVHEAQAAFDQARANEIKAENELDNAKEALREIIGDGIIRLDPLGEELALAPPEPEDIEEWARNADKHNLTIIAAQNRAEVARKNIEIQNAGHYPVLDVVASSSYQETNSIFGLRGDTESIGLQLSVPLFEGGAVSSRARQAHYDFEAAKETLVVRRRAIRRQVRDAFRGVITTITQVEALAAAVISSESALEATEAGQEVGTRTMVEVLAEQRNLFRAKRDYSRTRYDYLVNSLRLKQAAGNLARDDLERISEWITAKASD